MDREFKPGTEKGPGAAQAVNIMARREHFLMCPKESTLEDCPKRSQHEDDANWMAKAIRPYLTGKS